MERIGLAYQQVSRMGSEYEVSEVSQCLQEALLLVDQDLAEVFLGDNVSLENLSSAVALQQDRLSRTLGANSISLSHLGLRTV